MFNEPQNWSSNQGVGFDLHASNTALVFDINAHEGTPGSMATYYYAQETMPESVDGWVRIELNWSSFNRVDWEPDDGTPLDPAQIMGITFGLPTYEDTPNTGTIWIDNLELLASVAEEPEAPAPAPAEAEQQPESGVQPEAEPESEDETQPESEEEERGVGGFLPCSSPIAIAIVLAGITLRKKRYR
jgi:hypothetical protein